MPVGKRGGSDPGQRRGGRKVGSKSAAQTELEKMLRAELGERYRCPIVTMTCHASGIDPATGEPADYEPEFIHKAAADVAQYIRPKLKAVEHKGEGGGPIQVIIDKPGGS